MTKYFLVVLVLLGASSAFSATVKTVYSDETMVLDIGISTSGTVLSFPTKPSKVLLGKNDAFHVEYIDEDLAILPKGFSSSSNLFVYVLGRRFSLNLRTTPGAPAVYRIRDLREKTYRRAYK